MCTSPLYRLAVSEEIIAPNHVKFWKNGGIIRKELSQLQPFIAQYYRYADDVPVQQIPCGQCMACRIKRTKEWAQRCLAEQKTSKRQCYFLTLTYNDDSVLDKVIYTISRRTFEVGYHTNLVKSELISFIKDLRAYWKYHFNEDDIRFFGCGEYGSETGRCHFHLILFNIDIPDLHYRTIVTKTGGFKKVLCSDIIDKIWKKGFVTIGTVTADSCSYVAGYCQKKLTGLSKENYLSQIQEYNSKHPDFPVEVQNEEFIHMSRMPGIGREFFDLYKDKIYDNDEIAFPKLIAKPCSYYDKLFDLEQAELLEVIKNKRHFSAGIKQMNLLLGKTPEQAEAFIKEQNLLKDQKLRSKVVRGL